LQSLYCLPVPKTITHITCVYTGGYTIPRCITVEEYRNAIENLPDVDSPEVFGLHPNADIAYQTNTSNTVCLAVSFTICY